MEKHSKCIICGTILLTTMAISIVVANASICESCRKKLEETPHVIENDYSTNTQYSTQSFVVNVSGTASTSTTTTQPIIKN